MSDTIAWILIAAWAGFCVGYEVYWRKYTSKYDAMMREAERVWYGE